MNFNVGDYVTPHVAYIGYGSTFKIVEYDAEIRRYKIEFVSGTLSYGEKTACESCAWNEDDLEPVNFINTTVNTTVDTVDDTFSNNFITKNEVRVSDIEIKENEIQLPKYNIKINKDGIMVGENLIKNKKENNDMNKILEIYKERKKSKINEEYFENAKKIRDNDEIQIIVKEMENQIKTILENEERNFFGIISVDEYTEKTKNAIKELELKQDLSIDELMLQIEEVEALLNMTDNFEEKQKILKAYNILDKKGTLNV